MLFTTEWLAETMTGQGKEAFKTAIAILEVTTDSRKQTENALFVPLTGDRFDGHDYVEQAVSNGAVAVLWQKNKQLPIALPDDFPVFYVENTLIALQQLATAYRDLVKPEVIAVTGSNGKTTTKDLLASIIRTSFKTHYTEGNLNNQIGVPLTILSMPADTEVVVTEMGMNHAGEIAALSHIAKPDYAVITNIGESHIEYLGSREGIAEAKLEIVQGMTDQGCLLIDGDEELLNSVHDKPHVLACGFGDSNDVIIKAVNVTINSTWFQLSGDCDYSTPLLGRHHALNAAFAVTIGKLLNINHAKIKQGLSAPEKTSMRFELINGRNGSSLINDAYNASPTSMRASINVVRHLRGFNEKVLILGDMFELGDRSKQLHRSVADSIDSSVTAVFTIGNHAGEISSAVKQRYPSIDCRHAASKETLENAVAAYARDGVLILFKASRGMQFEVLVDHFSE
ncbi:UDP-N-acetylmuramoyl-tripeptide--D-alanyl-D-alanine ligase [Barrientosiimonas marina]|uniref:UDP-N-acetylmuramoyl-tripeptide--D-alanyl-D-alanine ligase n=1 Tax=Lentibacillus kimchii TaxID=1542911 RepID=A0ABW2UPB3_9BACI